MIIFKSFLFTLYIYDSFMCIRIALKKVYNTWSSGKIEINRNIFERIFVLSLDFVLNWQCSICCQYCMWQFLLSFMKESTCYVSCTLWKCAALAITLDGFAVVIKTQMELISFPSVWLADSLWSTLPSAEHISTICLHSAWRGWSQRNFLIITRASLNRVYYSSRSSEILHILYKGFHDSWFATYRNIH